MSTSTTCGCATSPTTVARIVPAKPAVPIVRNQSAPLARMWTAVASVSTLLTAVGLLSQRAVVRAPVLPADRHGGEQPVLLRRQQPRQRVTALDHLEEGLLLAVEVLVGALDDRDGEVDAGARCRSAPAPPAAAPPPRRRRTPWWPGRRRWPRPPSAAMAAPSSTRYGSRRMSRRSLKVAGSPSAPLATT